MIRRGLRHAQLVDGVHVITDARWPAGVRFEVDKERIFAQMRAEFETRVNRPWVRVRPGDFDPVVPFVHLRPDA